MTRNEAVAIHDRFLLEMRARRHLLVPDDWGQRPEPTSRHDAWVFVYRDEQARGGRYEGVIVPNDGSGPYIVLGAIGKVFRLQSHELGLPRSDERWLGSGPGRYQLFEHGVVVWDAGQEPGEDLAYPRFVRWLSKRGRTCVAAVAFTDLRGFTRWSGAHEPREVQALIARQEELLQDAFSQRRWGELFLKGTGDGVMIVTETGPREPGECAQYLCAFLDACLTYARSAKAVLPGELAVGCGVAYGRVLQTFLFGQTDYLGEIVNEASKLQQLAWNEVVVTKAVQEIISSAESPCRGHASRARALADRGFRIDIAERESRPIVVP